MKTHIGAYESAYNIRGICGTGASPCEVLVMVALAVAFWMEPDKPDDACKSNYGGMQSISSPVVFVLWEPDERVLG